MSQESISTYELPVFFLQTLSLLFFKGICIINSKSILHSTGKAACKQYNNLFTVNNIFMFLFYKAIYRYIYT